MNQTFGAFVRQKRMALGISLRGLAARLGLSPVYMSIIETDRKPAPAKEHLDRLAEELHLSKEERELFLDLAAASQKNEGPGRPAGVYHGAGHRPRRSAHRQGGGCH